MNSLFGQLVQGISSPDGWPSCCLAACLLQDTTVDPLFV